MALRARSRLPSSLSFSWRTRFQPWVSSSIPIPQTSVESDRGLSTAPQENATQNCCVSTGTVSQEAEQYAQRSCFVWNFSSGAGAVPAIRDGTSNPGVHQYFARDRRSKQTGQHHFPHAQLHRNQSLSVSHFCQANGVASWRHPRHLVVDHVAHARRFISSQGEKESKSVEAESTGAENGAKASLADEVEKDIFLKEVKGVASQGENPETESEEPDDTRLEKAERDYLEALGKGEVVDLDLEQLENLLGESAEVDDSYTVGTLYIKLGQEYDSNGQSADQILRCGQKALKILQNRPEDVRLEIGMALHLIAIAHVRNEKFQLALPIMHDALELFEKKGGEQSTAAKCALQFLLGEALSGLGRSDEALTHLTPAVAKQEEILGNDHAQLGRSYRHLAKVLTNVMKYEEALPYAKKALETHVMLCGEGSMEEAIDRRLIAVIHVGLEDHESALEQHVIVRKILSTSDHGSQTVFVDISTAGTEIALGKYDDAISSLEVALARVEKGSAMHALVLVNLAKVYELQKKPKLADQYAKQVVGILENRVLAKTDPLAVAEGFTELAGLYEKLNQTESAIDMLRKAHAIYALIPDQRNAVAGTQAQIGMLLFFTGKVKEAVPFLESAVQNLEGAVGEQNFALAMVLNHLGVANVELERLETATVHFERAKVIFDEVLGTDHDDTIAVARNLVNNYFLIDRVDDAVKYQKEVVRELKKKEGDGAKEMLDDAIGHLHMLLDHRENGKLASETLGSDPRKYGRVVSD